MDDKSTISNLLKIIYHQQQQLNVMHELIQKQYEPSVINQPQNSIPQSIITDPQNQTINPIPATPATLPNTPISQHPPIPIINPKAKVFILNGDNFALHISRKHRTTIKKLKKHMPLLSEHPPVAPDANLFTEEDPNFRNNVLDLLNPQYPE